jgi:GNAT superfamily N-acetyltransferase
LEATVEIFEADLGRADHRQAVVELTSSYASDAMGIGGQLPPDVLERLVPGLRAMPTTLILLAYADGRAIGIATCFRGFSTFAAKPLINIHDLAVLPGYRGRGVGRRLLEAVVRKADTLGCCKVTLEVLAENARARRMYEAAGFSHAAHGGNTGGTLFYSRSG